ncbi:MAG: methylmalonyl-CoA epimerase [Chloroflexota bacterium]
MITVNHIAIVVSDLASAQEFWVDALGLPLERVEDIPSEAVRVAFLETRNGQIELVQPTDQESGVARFLRKRGPGMHHLCLEVADIEATIDRLKAHGVELINETPRESADGRQYAFVHPRSTTGVLVELYQTAAPAQNDASRVEN